MSYNNDTYFLITS